MNNLITFSIARIQSSIENYNENFFFSKYDGGYVVRGFEDGRILVWDSKSGTCVHTLMGHNNSITCLKLRDNNLLSRCDGKLNVWDIVSGQCLLSVNTRKICDDFRTLVNKNFVMRLFGKSLHLWKIKTG